MIKKTYKLAPKALTEDESTLFRKTVGAIRPLADSGRHPLKPKSPEPVLRLKKTDTKALIDELASIDVDASETEHFLRPGQQQRVLRKLKRGHYPANEQLDLHNLNQQEATKLILEFLEFASEHKMRCIKIIHGKGLGSKNRIPVLMSLSRNLLRRHQAVLAFTPAKDSAGGTGAVYVLLKNSN